MVYRRSSPRTQTRERRRGKHRDRSGRLDGGPTHDDRQVHRPGSVLFVRPSHAGSACLRPCIDMLGRRLCEPCFKSLGWPLIPGRGNAQYEPVGGMYFMLPNILRSLSLLVLASLCACGGGSGGPSSGGPATSNPPAA